MNVTNSRLWLPLVVLLVSTPGAADTPVKDPLTGLFVQVEGHASLLSDIPEKALLSITFGYGVRSGYRWSGWGTFLHIEHNMWLSTELEKKVVDGALNIGIGGEYLYADGFVRTSLALGPSILMWDTILDPAGVVGFFLDLRPAGLRWVVHDNVALSLDPITFSMVAPVLSGIPLIKVEYRTIFGVEGVF